MNRSIPLQRAAIVVASAAAVATLGFAMAAGPSTLPAVDPVVDPVALTVPEPPVPLTEVAAPTPIETTEVDTVYVEPAATPEVIQEVRHATPAPIPAGKPSTAAADTAGTAASAGDDEESDDEHEDDDDEHEDDDEGDDDEGDDD